MRCLALVALLTSCFSVAPAAAQFGNGAGNLASDSAMSILYDNTRSNMMSSPGRPVRNSRPMSSAPVVSSLAYRPTPALARATVDGYVRRLNGKNPEAARAVADQFGRNDYGAIYRRLVAPFGLRDGNAADALTAYTVLSWMIANNAGDPGRGAVLAARNQIGSRLSVDPQLSTPRNRARAGEEFKLLFVTLHAGWQSARREGNLQPYADGVARLFQAQGTNLRALRLTRDGLVGR